MRISRTLRKRVARLHLAEAMSAVIAAALLVASPARADENIFGYSYGAETMPKGHWEVYQWATLRSGKGEGTYRAWDLRTEVEYGITDRFQAALYLNARQHEIRNVSGFADRDQLRFDGVSAEFKWLVLSPYKHKLGLALYFEPGVSSVKKISGDHVQEFEFETKVILQRNWLEDRLVWVFNGTFEPEFEREDDAPDFEGEYTLEATTGLAYRFAPRWFAGVELRATTAFADADWRQQDHLAYFAGPTVHYASQRWWATLTWLPQVRGWPDGIESGLTLEEHEEQELRFKLGIDF